MVWSPNREAMRGRVAFVAGATRGAGRGIAAALGEAGATVVCTGRSTKSTPSDYNRAETIEETAELVTQLGAHPSLAIGPLLETHKHDIGDILRESLGHEKATLVEYEKLLKVVEGEDVMLEEYAREHIYLERLHVGEVDKMLRKPGDIEAFEKANRK